MSIDGSRLQISVEEQDRWRRRVSVTVPSDLVAEEHKRAALSVASRVKMKGFRKGRVPSRMVESRFGGALRQETLDRIIKDAYRHALSSQELRPISEGEVEEVDYADSDSDLRFAIVFDVEPIFTLERMGGFAVEQPVAEASDREVEETLGRLQEQNGAWKPVEEGTPELNDTVSVRIRRLDGDEGEGAEAREYEFVLGQGDAIPEIEDAIRTLEVGASGEFTVTFPDDFPDEERRGQKEEVEITLDGRKVLDVPPLDDDFARQVGEFEDLDALRTRIRDDLQREAEERSEAAVRGRLLDFVIEANPFEVPRSMVERYVDSVLGPQAEQLPAERIEEVKANVRPQAEAQVKRLLLIERIAETRELQATEDEMDERIEEIAAKNDTDAGKVYASLQKSGRLEALEREIMERKVFDFLKSQSDIIESTPA